MEADDFNLLVLDEGHVLVGIETKGAHRVEIEQSTAAANSPLISTRFPDNERIMGLKGIDQKFCFDRILK